MPSRKKTTAFKKGALVLAAGFFLSGCCERRNCCEEETPDIKPTAADVSKAATMMPADPTLSEIYTRSCKACHSNAQTGAPLTGHAAAWNARLEDRGFDGLLYNAQAGYKSMPPLGACMDCDNEQFGKLIKFMAGSQP
ncbi:MAG: c-type cytochrome [Alphaproteobacteria bacterium]|nr:c-type cytochrome [Alphaproteobacteria bacterium]